MHPSCYVEVIGRDIGKTRTFASVLILRAIASTNDKRSEGRVPRRGRRQQGLYDLQYRP
jgi:hypothetical protein